MVRVFVIGVGMTNFEKPGRKNGDYPQWAREAILQALEDSDVKFTDIEFATAGFVYGDSTSGQRVIYEIGMTGIPIVNVHNFGATGSTALYLAKEMVEVGKYDCTLAVGFEKMEKGSLKLRYEDRTNPMDKHVEVIAEMAGLDVAPMTAQMFGNAGIEHMQKYGTKPEHFAKIAYKNHKHSVNNPRCQFQKEYSLQEILSSSKVFGPLTLLQCCANSDGAAAAIIASESFVKKHGLERQAVEILGMEMSTDLPSTFLEKSHLKIVGYDMTRNAVEKLWRKTGKTPADVQVIELHDCYTCNELVTYEALGLCSPGKAGEFIDRRDNTYGGKYVINPSGGLISRGNPLGATGLAQCAELVWQLRGEAGARQVPGAKLALQHNIGLGGAVVVALYQLGYPEHHTAKVGIRKVSPENFALVEEGFIVTRYLTILQTAMDEDEDGLIEQHRSVFGLRVIRKDGKIGQWVINCKEGRGKIIFNGKNERDVVFTVRDEDVLDFITGKVSLQKAFFEGKLKIEGNIGLGMTLVSLQERVARKFEALRAKL